MGPTPPPHDDDRTVMPGRTVVLPPGQAPASFGSNTLPVGTRLGEFEITGLIGEGGFGIVYLAQDHSLGRQVALKEYMPSALAARTGTMTVSVKSERHAETFAAGLRSFINEARLLARFDHPSLVKVYRFWEANGTAYMVMPFYEGMTLKETLRRLGGPPDENWLKDLLRPLLDALAQIHREQCFHRDIAPDNILILANGRPVLLDFGAARRVIGDMTHALTVILKPGYAPVEQYAEVPNMKQGAWTDIYALAAVVYFAITGKPPVPSVSRMMSDTLVPLSQVAAGRYSEQFLRGVDQALVVRPEQRPQDVAQLRALLGLSERRQRPRAPVPGIAPEVGIATAKSETAKAETASREARKTEAAPTVPETVTQRPMGPFAVGAVAIVALVAGAAFFLLRDGNKAEPVVAAKPTPAAVPAEPSDKPPMADKKEILVPPAAPVIAEKNVDSAAGPISSRTQESPFGKAQDRPFSPGLMLDDIFAGRDRAHAVTVSVDKAQVRIDKDFLRFGVSSSKPGYVYVLVVGTNHSDFNLLFPNDKDTDNRISPARPLELPRNTWPLRARGPAGTNQLVAIVSDAPRDFSGLKPIPDGFIKKFSPDVSAQLYRDYSGPTPLFAGRPVCAAGADCPDSYGAAVFSIEEMAVTSTPPVTAKASPAPKSSATPAAVDSSPRMEAGAERCSEILQRKSLGEPLTAEEQTILQRNCK